MSTMIPKLALVLQPFIWGGEEVKWSDPVARSTVAVVMPGVGTCSGSLISDDMVLTAAHCVHGEEMNIVFASSLTEQGAPSLPVVAREIHPGYNRFAAKDYNDLAILRIRGNLPAGYEPVRLAGSGFLLNAEMPVVLAGYGVSDIVQRKGSGTLRRTTVAVLDPEFSKGEMSVNQRKGTGACFGDSGGPALVQSKDGASFELIGVTHGGPACDDYGIYTKSFRYLDWIEQASVRLR